MDSTHRHKLLGSDCLADTMMFSVVIVLSDDAPEYGR